MSAAALAFRGSDTMVDQLDEAVNRRNTREITDRLRRALCGLMRESRVALPDEVFSPNPDHYARRLLHNSDELGYSVVAMTWGPGQGTPIHDHCGMWCVEAVWAGELEVTQYEILEQQDDRYRFESVASITAGRGSAGALIPPHEYHTIVNRSSDQPAVSVHIYSGEMRRCCVYEPESGATGEAGWCRRIEKKLCLDS